MSEPEAEKLVRLGETPFLSEYTEDFQSSYLRKTPAEVAAIPMLADTAWPLVWQPDAVAAAYFQWLADQEAGDKDAQKTFERSVMAAEQNAVMPRVIIRRFEQFRPELFPIQSLVDCTLLYAGVHGMPGRSEPERPENQDPYYTRSYLRGREWLNTLPVKSTQKVYVARAPEETLIVEWGEFVLFWDAFYCNRFCSVNVCDDSNGWFLMAHMERFMVFGCTEEYGNNCDLLKMTRISYPIDYRTEISQARDDFDHFRESMFGLDLMAT